MTILVFDLETQALATDVAPDGKPITWARNRLHLMGLSWGCTWSSDGHFRHYCWLQESIASLAREVEQADLLVSFNGIAFDLPLLSGLVGRTITPRRHCDLLALCHASLGWRPSLASLAQTNLGTGKSGFGGHAPQLWRDQRYGELASYCERDVRLTRDLFFLAAGRGYLLSPEGQHILTPEAQVQGKESSNANQEILHDQGAPHISGTPSLENAATGLQGGKEAMSPGKACVS